MDLADQDYLKRIHQDALQVLEEVGVKCASGEIRRIFEETGLAAFDETTGHLHILSPLVEQALGTAPKRDQYWIPENAFGVGGTAPFVYDDRTGDLVEPTFEHLVRIAQIVDEAEEVRFMARGVLIKKQEVKVMDTLVEHCGKPLYVAAVTEEGINRAKEICDSRGKLTVQFSIINSPLNVIESMIPPFLSCVRKGIPIYVSTMPMAGLSSPYSMSGLLTLTHAEALFGITLTQLVRPGLMVVHAGLPSIASIRNNYAVDLGLVSHNVANLLLEKINRMLGIPSVQTACTTSQEHPNRIAEGTNPRRAQQKKILKSGVTQQTMGYTPGTPVDEDLEPTHWTNFIEPIAGAYDKVETLLAMEGFVECVRLAEDSKPFDDLLKANVEVGMWSAVPALMANIAMRENRTVYWSEFFGGTA